ncbi:DUF2066 domain-containing protein [Mesorhizobium sp. NBSH29]|uniref:DUF2066 domain-containing protein n=1 Tax=Mesorhizobium sp. NBSH29 TaxID=2654249 RepID=UPI0018965AB4|nr:DUF2066 domain-containing protein [Mesorhizobium sp. NBSH29]
MADGQEELYRATVIVTGEREETRIPGLRSAFETMMSKVSGQPDIASNAKFAHWSSMVPSFVWSYTYHDRFFGRPIHDEQGTRDRPFDLTVQFEPSAINDILADMNEKAWPEPRPILATVIEVKWPTRRYMLSVNGRQGIDQRESLLNASRRFGVPIALVSPDASAVGAEADSFVPMDEATLEKIAKASGTQHVLVGQIAWSENDLGWVGTWQLWSETYSERWSVRGVSFDAAFRDAIGGAAQVLSHRS